MYSNVKGVVGGCVAPVVFVEQLGVPAEVEFEVAAGALDDGVVRGVRLGHVVDQLVTESTLELAQPAGDKRVGERYGWQMAGYPLYPAICPAADEGN